MALRGKRVMTLPEGVSFTHCPAGHELPHTAEGIDCAPDACGADVREGVQHPVSGMTETDLRQEGHEAQRLNSRLKVRRKLVPMPEGLDGAEAEAYVEKRLHMLSVPAVAELEYQLLHEDSADRARAARDILEATGHGKKERNGQAANLIVINMGGGKEAPPLPWSQVVDAAVKVLP